MRRDIECWKGAGIPYVACQHDAHDRAGRLGWVLSYQCSVPTKGMHRNCSTYRNTHTGTKARIATSQQYPNSSSSLPLSSPRLYRPRRRPGRRLFPGPRSRPTRKKKSVAVTSERSRKCPNMKTRVMCRVCVKPSA